MRISALVVLAISVSTSPALPAAGLDLSRVRSLSKQAQAASEGASADYLAGDPQKALARLRRIGKSGDAEAAFVLGNMTWTLHPEESFAWHQQALAWGGDSAPLRMELALHYTRQENCPEALKAWRSVDEAGGFGGYFPALAAYCHLVLGQDRAAFAMFDRVKFGHAGRFEGLLEEIWGVRPALARHGDTLAAFKAGQPMSGNALLEAATALSGYDGQRARALTAILDRASKSGTNDPALDELACLKPWINDEHRRGEQYRKRSESYDFPDEAERAQEKRQRGEILAKALRDCGLMLDAGRLPTSDALARALLADTMELDLATAQDLLARHGPALMAREATAAGDKAALGILAAMQLRAEDRQGLALSDLKGWERYRDARFAASRVAGLMGGSTAEQALAPAEARRAWKDFPDNAHVLMLVLAIGELQAEDRKRALRSQVLAEFHGPTAESVLHASMSAVRLVQALREYRKLVEAEGLGVGG